MATDSDARRVLDVRTLEEPPFGPIMEELDALSEDESLVVVNSFEPEPLYGVLEARGFSYETLRVDDDEWRIHVVHAEADRAPRSGGPA